MNEFNTTRHHAKFLGLLGIFIILEVIGNPVKTIARSVGGSEKKNKNKKVKISEALKEGDFFCLLRTRKGGLILVFADRDFSCFGLVVCFCVL